MMTRSKKRKFDEVGKDPVKVYFDPKRIPLELWIFILEYIPGKDLLNLSLVCKLFNKTIGCLPEAMDKISLKLNERTLRYVKLILKSSRNYNNITLERINVISDVTICKRIIGKYGENLRTLKFLICELPEGEIKDILAMVQNNLRTLRFDASKLKVNTQHSSKSAVDPIMSRLSKILISAPYRYNDNNNGIEKVFDLLPDTLLEVDCAVEYSNDFQPQLSRFLHRQKNLKHLCLKSLRNTECLNEIDSNLIKLTKLEIGLLYDTNNNRANLDKFLQSHAESLKELTFEDISLNSLNVSFKNMPNLKLLKLVECIEKYPRNQRYESGPNFNCPNLKTFIFNSYGNSPYSFVSRFPNVEEITYENGYETNHKGAIEKIAKNHPNLKTLVVNEFDDSSFKSLSFKNLKKLEIHEIYLDECYDDDFKPREINMEHSIYALTNLEILKLGSNVLTTITSLMFILFNSKKLQHLEIDNGSRLSDYLLCEHLNFFKNLRFLKILNLPGSVENFIDSLLKFPNLKHTLSNRSVPIYEFSV